MAFFLIVTLMLGIDAPAPAGVSPEIQLGEKFFFDLRFSSPQGDMQTSCASCHQIADPQGDRAFTEFLSRSWHPWRGQDPGRETLRNTPTLLDVAQMQFLHYDGEFRSPEDQVEKTFVGRNMGWLPEERGLALAQLVAVLAADTGEDSYRSLYQRAYGIDLEKTGGEAQLVRAGAAVAAFMRSLNTTRNTAYDRFVEVNGLDPEPRAQESPSGYAARFLAQLEALERESALKLPSGFDVQAYKGLWIFFDTGDSGRAGSCVACHVPPYFADFTFHNTGVAQEEYDRIHGDGAFAQIEIPAYDAAVRPAKNFMARAKRGRAGQTDLGFWNFADPKTSPFREKGETENAYLARTVATFKTPTLRGLASTDPYSHNGEYAALEDVIAQKIRAGALAREGKIRNADPALANIRIGPESAKPLFAFLNTLNDQNKRRSQARGQRGASAYSARSRY